MLSMTKLSKESQELVSKLAAEGSKTLLASLAIAKVIAYGLDLPSSKVESVNQYFNVTHKIKASEIVFTINEIIILDTNIIIDYIIKFYNYRYDHLYPNNVVIAVNPNTGIIDFFNISKYFDNATLEVIATNPSKLTMYCNKMRNLITELLK